MRPSNVWNLTLLSMLAGACAEEQLSNTKGNITATPSLLDFAEHVPTTVTTLEVSLANDGRSAIDISTSEIRNDVRGAFALVDVPKAIAGGTSVKLVVSYKAPGEAGTDSATIILTSNADNAPTLSIPLVARSAAPTCTDGALDGRESDLDCGGDVCGGCESGRACTATTDCASALACLGGICSPCADSTQCRTGQVCADGKCSGCARDRDCDAGSTCVAGACAVCPGATGRIDTQQDALHCGGCNQACALPAHAAATCTAAKCGRAPCEEGFFDLDAAATFGCEATCTARVCRDDAGKETRLNNDPIHERHIAPRSLSSGSTMGAGVQTSTGYTNAAVLGETAPQGAAAPQQSARYRHIGGVVGTQR